MNGAVRIAVDYEPGLEAAAKSAGDCLAKALPQHRVAVGSVRQVPAAAWDSATGLYDVSYLLDALGPQPGGSKTLWLVNRHIGDFWQRQLLGAAGDDRAVVAAVLPGSGEVAREALHETGHMLGLGHCANHCCMKPSPNAAAARDKPEAFCPECRARLAR